MADSTHSYLDRIVQGDCMEHLPHLQDDSIHCFISDIPYGINQNDWDVLHANTNSALLGQSPAQRGKSAFERRGKPLRGWNQADRLIPQEYQAWCGQWGALVYPKLKDGASVFIFGARRMFHRAVIALEDCGFILRDILAWEKPSAHHRAQRLSGILERRGLHTEAEYWQGWRLGNLAPKWEPIAWMFKPYRHTLTDNILRNEIGAINLDAAQLDGKTPPNLLNFWFEADEPRLHETQKPLRLVEFLVSLTTREGQIVLDPFIGSGTTAVACKRLRRHYIGFDLHMAYVLAAEERLRLV